MYSSTVEVEHGILRIRGSHGGSSVKTSVFDKGLTVVAILHSLDAKSRQSLCHEQ